LESSTASADVTPLAAVVIGAPTERERFASLARMAFLLALGWLGTNIALQISEFTLKFELKDRLGLTPAAIAGFFAIGQFTNYIKPVAGVLTDGIPLFGTRRRHYLLLGIGGGGILWLALGLVPKGFGWLLATYTLFYITVVLTSTTLGGKMVEVGIEHNAAGRLTAQRIGMFRLAALIGGPIGGWLAGYPFLISVVISAAIHFALAPLLWRGLPESGNAVANMRAWESVKHQGRTLVRSRTLLAAAFMVFLLAASPGFNTPLLFHQTDHLHFSKQFIGNLGLVSAATGLLGAWFYYAFCRRCSLRVLMAGSIVVHAGGTLLYLAYRDVPTAIIITALAGITQALTMLPVYDLAARATPRGSEALGYSVMMSAWNLTNMLSDWTGSVFYDSFNRSFHLLIYLNAGTTAFMLFVVPFLPVALLNRKDGQSA
jgi:Na+/melibiose symporter-like transporter